MVIADAAVNGFLPYKGLAGKNASLAKSFARIVETIKKRFKSGATALSRGASGGLP